MRIAVIRLCFRFHVSYRFVPLSKPICCHNKIKFLPQNLELKFSSTVLFCDLLLTSRQKATPKKAMLSKPTSRSIADRLFVR